jgi:hypothetical protein
MWPAGRARVLALAALAAGCGRQGLDEAFTPPAAVTPAPTPAADAVAPAPPPDAAASNDAAPRAFEFQSCSVPGRGIAKSPAGDGRWGQSDLAGLRGEWTLDWLRDYVDPCVDCVNLQPPTAAELAGANASRVVRGYAHIGPTPPLRLLVSVRGDDAYGWSGFRCARRPKGPL